MMSYQFLTSGQAQCKGKQGLSRDPTLFLLPTQRQQCGVQKRGHVQTCPPALPQEKKSIIYMKRQTRQDVACISYTNESNSSRKEINVLLWPKDSDGNNPGQDSKQTLVGKMFSAFQLKKKSNQKTVWYGLAYKQLPGQPKQMNTKTEKVKTISFKFLFL